MNGSLLFSQASISKSLTESSSTKRLTNSFCPCKKRFVISISRCNGEDYKYVYDEELSTFKPLPCIYCQPPVSEKDLLPIYSIEHSGKTVTFAHNLISDKHEQFVYNEEAEGFEQVNFPELIFDSSRSSRSDILFTVNTKKGQVVIRKDKNQQLTKERCRNGTMEYIPMESVQVKTLPFGERVISEDEKMRDRPRFSIQFDKELNREVVYVLQYRKLLSVHWYNNLTGDFELTHTSGSPTERFLYPKKVSKVSDNFVIHAENGMTGAMEHFIYSKETRGFEQIQFFEAKYYSSVETKSDVLCIIKGDEEPIIITRDPYFGYIKKNQLNGNSGQVEELPAVDVIFLSMKQEEPKKTISFKEDTQESSSSEIQPTKLDIEKTTSLADTNLEAEYLDSPSSVSESSPNELPEDVEQRSEPLKEVNEIATSLIDYGYSTASGSPEGRSPDVASPDSMESSQEEKSEEVAPIEEKKSDAAPTQTKTQLYFPEEDVDSDNSDIDMSVFDCIEMRPRMEELSKTVTANVKDTKKDSFEIPSGVPLENLDEWRMDYDKIGKNLNDYGIEIWDHGSSSTAFLKKEETLEKDKAMNSDATKSRRMSWDESDVDSDDSCIDKSEASSTVSSSDYDLDAWRSEEEEEAPKMFPVK